MARQQRSTPRRSDGLARLFHKAVVEDGAAGKDGRLVLRFADGRVIEANAHEQYEAWQLDLRLRPIERTFQLIALPGGSTAEF